MARSLNHLYGQVTDHCIRWRALRWCTRLAKAGRTEFEEMVSQVIVDIDSVRAADAQPIEEHAERGAVDVALEAAVAGLSQQQHLLLYLMMQGATYHEIAAALRMRDESALRDMKDLLCDLADKVSGAPGRA
jgi:DNA-directed RNA polymerase specialized sigma24 family protein